FSGFVVVGVGVGVVGMSNFAFSQMSEALTIMSVSLTIFDMNNSSDVCKFVGIYVASVYDDRRSFIYGSVFGRVFWIWIDVVVLL
ncbi:hypothetical protein L9F63_006456, partial [Diploptera punctata]